MQVNQDCILTGLVVWLLPRISDIEIYLSEVCVSMYFFGGGGGRVGDRDLLL